MRYPLLMALGWVAALVAAPPISLAAPGAAATSTKAMAPKASDTAAAKAEELAAARDAQELAAKIDRFLADRWAAAGVRPAPRADDATFLRRVYLDLAGRIP